MNKLKLLFTFIAFLLITACGNDEKNNNTKTDTTETSKNLSYNFPEVQKLDSIPNTDFVLTLESPLNTSKNGVYAASILVAWDEMKKDIGLPITEIESKDLELVDKSSGLQNGLKREEWEITIEKTEEGRKIKALFTKALPFEFPLDKIDKALDFQGVNVKNLTSFSEKNTISEILYYNNDDDFAISLLPKDTTHKIILIKTSFPENTTFKQELEKFESNKKIFEETKNEDNYWKYYYENEDKLIIPMIALHIEKNYESIEGTTFTAEKSSHNLIKVYQRNAFILNEKGAIIETEAEIGDVETEALPEEIKPKNLIFNKPFLLLLKKKDSSYPYFAIFIADAELLQK